MNIKGTGDDSHGETDTLVDWDKGCNVPVPNPPIEYKMETNTVGNKTTTITLPVLSTTEHTSINRAMLKLFEEGGELAQAIGKRNGVNGRDYYSNKEVADEAIKEELIDVAQTLITVIGVINREFGIQIKGHDLIKHHEKLQAKGYL